MANEIDLIVGSEAFAQITKLLTELGKVDTELGKLATSFGNLGKGATNPSDSAALKTLTDNNAKLNAEILKLSQSYDVLNDKLKKATDEGVKRGKYVTQEVIDTRALNKEYTIKYTELSKVAGAYANLDAEHKKFVKTAQDEAAANRQSGEEYKKAILRANELGARLKAIDADVGKHTRNVGNYSSSWNGLSNSINQLTREAPAFANSVQTGFMALSNNLPILGDEINAIREKNKALARDGEPTVSVFKTLASSFFSWQTAISIGVTLLTVYGAKLWELATAGDAASKAQAQLAEANAEAAKDASKEIGQLDVLYRTSQNHALSIEQRKRAVDKMQEVYPSYFANLKDEEILNGRAKESYLDLREGILASARAKAISSKLDENASSRFDKELELQNRIVSAQKDVADAYRLKKDITTQVIGSDGQYYETTITKEKEIELSNKRLKKAKQDLFDFNKQAGKDDLFLLQELEKAEIKAAKRNFDATKLKKEKVDKPKEDRSAEEAAKKEDERLKREYEALKSNLDRQKEIDKDGLESFKGSVDDKIKLSIQLAQDEIDIANVVFNEKKRLAKGDVDLITVANNEKLTAEENAQQENLKRVKKYYEDVNKETAEYYKNNPPLFVESPEAKKAREKQEADRKKSLEEQAAYLKSFATEFASNSGFPETFKMLSGEIEGFGTNSAVTFNAIAEGAQEMFNFIGQASQASFDQEYARLEAQKESSLKFAGDSSAAKEKIEEQYSKKKKEIEIREFKQKQKMSLANIAIDTAQAIVSIWAQVPKVDFGISATALSIFVGALGAVQAGMVLSQKPPAYAEGTDNHSGGLMLVNDGKGSNYEEKVILPNGKVIRPQGRNVLMDAPKGTKVLNHEQQLFEMLQSNNISMLPQQSSGMTPEEMDLILGKHFGNIKTQNTIFDKNGFQTYVRNGNSITRSNSNRSQAIGISV
jgi:hypothetical protein